jgi:hypothetical protein
MPTVRVNEALHALTGRLNLIVRTTYRDLGSLGTCLSSTVSLLDMKKNALIVVALVVLSILGAGAFLRFYKCTVVPLAKQECKDPS